MRLFQRNGWWNVGFYRGKVKALGTKDEARAKEIFKELQAEYLRGKLRTLESDKKTTLSKFRDDYLTARPGISPATVKVDKHALKALIDVVGPTIQMRAITVEKINEFKTSCLARNIKPRSVNTYLRHIKAALTYALETGIIEKKPKIKMVPTGAQIPRVLSPEQIEAVLAKAQEKNQDLYRYIVFCLWTGARRSEAKNLTWQAIKWKDKTCLLVGKGNKERLVPLLPQVIEAFHPVKRDVGPVFAFEHADTYSHAVKEIIVSCGITDRRLHDLRHTAATYMLKNGIDIRTVQKILGHAAISTTTIYADVLIEVLKSEMSKLRFD